MTLGGSFVLQIVQLGEKLKASKKKQKMASSAGTCSRDWGKVGEEWPTLLITSFKNMY